MKLQGPVPERQIAFCKARNRIVHERNVNPRPKNENYVLTLVQLVAVSVGVLIFRGGSY